MQVSTTFRQPSENEFCKIARCKIARHCTNLGTHHNPTSLVELHFSEKMFFIQIIVVSLQHPMIKSVCIQPSQSI